MWIQEIGAANPAMSDCRHSDEAPPLSDADLMLAVKTGDLRAFESLVERHQFRVIGTVAKMLGDEVEAEDIAQQVFVRVWKSAGRYEPSAKFTTWLLTITRNLVFNEMRRRNRHPAHSMDEPGHDDTVRQFADTRQTSPAEKLEQMELSDAIESAIASLPEAQRMAVILRRYEDMPYEEIARVLQSTVPAVKSMLFRARSQMRELLEKFLA